MPPTKPIADVQALRRRARDLQAVAGWIGLAAVVAFGASIALARFDPAQALGFGDVIHVPPSAVDLLRAQGAPLIQPLGELEPEEDYWRSRGTGAIALLTIIVGFIAVARRRWALLGAAVAVFLAALVIGRARPVDAGEIWGLRPAGQPDAFAVKATGGSVGRDAAYILAQQAFLDRRPAEVGRQLTAMGSDYPQASHLTRARVDAMVAYALAHHVDHRGPRAAPRIVPVELQRSISRVLAMLTGLGALASLTLDVLGAQLRRRAARMERLAAATSSLEAAIASPKLAVKLRGLLDARTDRAGLARRARLLRQAATLGAAASLLLALFAYGFWAPDPAGAPAFQDMSVVHGFDVGHHTPPKERIFPLFWLAVMKLIGLAFSALAGLFLLLRRRFLWAAGCAAAIALFSQVPAEGILNSFQTVAQLVTVLAALVLLVQRRFRPAQACICAVTLSILVSHNVALRRAHYFPPTESAAVERQLHRFAEAQAAYIDRDPRATAQALSQLDPTIEIASIPASWRISVMREWVVARGESLAPNAYKPQRMVPLSAKRLAANLLWTLCALALLAATAAAALAATIRLRLERLVAVGA